MVFAGELLEDINSFINQYGTIIRIRKFTKTIGAGSMDDDVLLTSGVNVWTSGLIQSIGTNESNLVQQGLLKRDDFKIYVSGDVNISGLWKLGVGSPTTEEYALANRGTIDAPQVNGSVLYQKAFIRKLQNGSLFGE